MARTITAVEAQAQLDVLLRQVVENDERVIVTCDDQPQAVILSVAAYERLSRGHGPGDWRQLVVEARDRIRADLAGREPIPADEIIRRMRAERDAELLDRC